MKVKLILNPTAGQGRARRMVAPLSAAIRRRGYATEVVLTRGPGEAQRAAAEADDDATILLVAGGDGTITEVCHGNLKRRLPLMILPLGTANLLARELELPFSLPGVAALLDEPVTRKIDLLRCDVTVADSEGQLHEQARTCSAVASAGFDASVVRRYAERRDGGSALLVQWLLQGLAEFASYTPRRIDVTLDGEPVPGVWHQAIVANTRHYGGPIEPIRPAQVDDGKLDLVLLRIDDRQRLLEMIARTGLAALEGDHDVRFLSGRVVELSARKDTIELQIDGDPAGQLPARFVLLPDAAEIVVPRDQAS